MASIEPTEPRDAEAFFTLKGQTTLPSGVITMELQASKSQRLTMRTGDFALALCN